MRASAVARAQVRSTTASGSLVYESERAVHEYLQFHYAPPHESAPYAFAPLDALDFLPRAAASCARHLPADRLATGRALDVGCAVGRATFELSRSFSSAVGVDFSHQFVATAEALRVSGRLPYESQALGDVFEAREALLPAGVRADRVQFVQGDACALPASLGTFDAVLAANLLCRLPDPAAFLADAGRLVTPGGVLALVSPYSWLDEYTPRDKWLGGTRDASGRVLDSFEAVEMLLKPRFELLERWDAPFLLREHARKFQWGVSDASVWRRRAEADA